jgi:hypothetical protein
VVNDDVSLAALRMIASEETLQNKDVLDQIGLTQKLTALLNPDMSVLEHLMGLILAALPDDIAGTYECEANLEGHLRIASSMQARTILHLRMAYSETGERFVLASISTIAAQPEELSEGNAVLLASAVNDLNSRTLHGALLLAPFETSQMLLLKTGAACSMRANLDNWAQIVAYLLAASQAALEEEGGPAKSYIAVRAMSVADADPFSRRELIGAALAFRDSLIPELRNVTHITPGSDGVVVTVPFRVDGTTKALSILVRRVETDDAGVAGLSVLGSLYTTLPWDEAVQWSGFLNGLDEQDPTPQPWNETTPWLLGRWYAHNAGASEHPVMFSGFVPSALHAHADVEAIIRGTVKEVWAASDKYRLRKEFNATVGGIDGAV